MKQQANIVIDNARLLFKNFSGKEGKFNPKGTRTFCVALTPEMAKDLVKDGWNVKTLNSDDNKEPLDILKVKVSFGVRPPKIVIIQEDRMSTLEEPTVNILDWADIEKADVCVTPYHYNVNGKEGVSAYLKSIFVTLYVDELSKRYHAHPTATIDYIGGCGNCDICDGSCNSGNSLND